MNLATSLLLAQGCKTPTFSAKAICVFNVFGKKAHGLSDCGGTV